MIVVKVIEGHSLRDVIIRVGESDFLRNFTRIFSADVMSFTELDTAIKSIAPETWEEVNDILKRYARRAKKINVMRLRVDSTVCETNIHYPTEASLLWDSFRVAARLMQQCVEADAVLSMGNRFHGKKVKRLYTFVSTRGARNEVSGRYAGACGNLLKKSNGYAA